jgi:hypothetical protein
MVRVRSGWGEYWNRRTRRGARLGCENAYEDEDADESHTDILLTSPVQKSQWKPGAWPGGIAGPEQSRTVP